MLSLLVVILTPILVYVFYQLFHSILYGRYVQQRFEKASATSPEKPKRFIWRPPPLAKSLINRIEKMLSEASLPVDPLRFLRQSASACLIAALLAWALTGQIWTGVLSLTGSPLIIRWWLTRAKGQRVRHLTNQLPDVLDTISGSLRAGYSLMQAMSMLAAEGAPPTSEEFYLILEDIRMGKSYEDAFGRFAERNPTEEIQAIVTATLISRETGGNLSNVLDTVAQTLREKEQLRREVNSLTAQGRLSGLILFLLPFAMALFIQLINPDYLTPLYTTTLGQALVVGGLLGQLVGALVIRRIIMIDW
ncbi:hypothetical protein GTO89_05410 [Heliobacterium gestii]|uniref:Type II secretion system protein GspF domain-containing protein n=1 Tax=Heliomicrobium gestii TaxID=2699 RepID=A0A845L713_HELGE|nr:type II secretion system F family protein [Heliomicrobium gestii]MBM7866197.1 tight adherence protein B [Heliomicrobium gestii]MZP42477.1 hypothetical protein [Heliomicrobium gestii]